MSVDRSKEIDNILFKLIPPCGDPEAKRIFFVNGLFGVGKSWMVDRLESEIFSKKLADATLKCNEFKDIAFLPDLLYCLSENFIDIYNEEHILDFNETDFCQAKFLESLIKVKETDKKLFDRLVKKVILKSKTDILMSNNQDLKNEDELKTEIEKIHKKKNAVKILFDTSVLVSESFIVDLMNHFYKLNDKYDSFDKYISEKYNPRKIVFILDNYEPVAGSVNDWILNSFIPFCFSGTFGDFISYDIDLVDPKRKISDFFDFRFIVSGRDELNADCENVTCKEYKKDFYNVELNPFSKIEISDYLEFNRVNSTENIENVENITKGLPLILNLWIESVGISPKDTNISAIYHMLSEKYLKYKTDYEKEWIRCAAFLDEFDELGLKCFPQMNKNYKRAYYYFKNTSELLGKCDNQSNLRVHPVVKEFIREALKFESPMSAREFEKIVSVYNEHKTAFGELSGKESEIIRSLAYFNNFDMKYAVKEAFEEDYDLVRRLIEKHPDWFVRKKFTFSIEETHSDLLNKYNKLIDLDDYDNRKKAIGGIWAKYANDINTKKKELNDEGLKLNEERTSLAGKIKTEKERLSELQAKFISSENKMIELRSSLGAYTSSKNLYTAISNISIAVMVAVFAFFVPEIINLGEAGENTPILQKALFGVAGLFGLLGIFFLIKMIRSKSSKEVDEINTELLRKNEQQEIYKDEMNHLKEENEKDEKKLAELDEQIKKITDEIKIEDEKLEETFV